MPECCCCEATHIVDTLPPVHLYIVTAMAATAVAGMDKGIGRRRLTLTLLAFGGCVLHVLYELWSDLNSGLDPAVEQIIGIHMAVSGSLYLIFAVNGFFKGRSSDEPRLSEIEKILNEPRVTELFAKLVPVMRTALLNLSIDEKTIEGEAGGTIIIGADNVMIVEDFTQDGQLTLNGEMTFDGMAQPPTLRGDLVASDDFYETPVDLVLDMTVDLTTEPPFGGTVTVDEMEYQVRVLMNKI